MGATDTATHGLHEAARPSHNESTAPSRGGCVDSEDHLPAPAVEEIATLLAKGFLRYWKSRRLRPAIEPVGPENGLDSQPTQSLHVSVVDTTREEENG